MSALPPKADIRQRDLNVRFVPKPDVRQLYRRRLARDVIPLRAVTLDTGHSMVLIPLGSVLHELSQGHFTCSGKPGEDIALIIDPDFFR